MIFQHKKLSESEKNLLQTENAYSVLDETESIYCPLMNNELCWWKKRPEKSADNQQNEGNEKPFIVGHFHLIFHLNYEFY